MKSSVTENIRITFDHWAKLFKSLMLRIGNRARSFRALSTTNTRLPFKRNSVRMIIVRNTSCKSSTISKSYFTSAEAKRSNPANVFSGALRIDANHVHVLRAVAKNRDQERLCQYGKRVRRIRLGGGIDNGNSHRHVPDS